MIHPSAVIEPGSLVGDRVQIGPFVHVGQAGRAAVEKGAGSSEHAEIGDDCILRSHGVLYAGARFADGVRTGHHWLVREGSSVGEGALVGTGVTVDDRCTIGARVSLQTGVYVPTLSVIEDDVFLGPRVVLTNDKYMGRPAELVGCTIRRGARIGANAVILPGIEVGAEAVIGSGAVVTKDVPEGAIVAGNPATHRGAVPQEQRLG